MWMLFAVLGSGCAPESFSLSPPLSWAAVTSAGPAPVVVALSRAVDDASVGLGQEDQVCPPDAVWLGGRGPDAVCLTTAGVAVRVTRSPAGLTVARDGGAAVCPAALVFVGTSGRSAVCVGDGAGTAVSLTQTGAASGMGAPARCPADWTEAGSQGVATVCWRPGEGYVASLTRDERGRRVDTVADPAVICPAETVFLGTNGASAQCFGAGPGTAVRMTSRSDGALEVAAPDCPDGWRALGGDGAGRVCLHPSSLVVAALSRRPDGPGWPALMRAEHPCPEGLSPVGLDADALLCVEGVPR